MGNGIGRVGTCKLCGSTYYQEESRAAKRYFQCRGFKYECPNTKPHYNEARPRVKLKAEPKPRVKLRKRVVLKT